MSSLLFWMIFIQVSIFFIGAFLIISWLVLEPKQMPKNNGRNRSRPRRARLQPAERSFDPAEMPMEA